MTVEDLFDPEHTSKPRNKLIAQVFYDLGLIERYGNGIHRILDACREGNLPEPLLENFSGGFRIKFMLSEQAINKEAHINVPLNKRIIETIELNPGLKRKDIAVALDVTEKTISRYVSELSLAGKIERRGSKKTGGYWILGKDLTAKQASIT